MRRAFKWILTGWPVVLLVGLTVQHRLSLARAERAFVDPAGVVWGDGDAAVHVGASETEEGETLVLRAEARDAGGRVLVSRELSVDRDHFGGGLVRATQVDDDPDLEVVAWGLHEEDTSFFLDRSGREAVARPFAEASEAAHTAVRAWHQARHVDGLTVVLALFLALAYYAALGFVWLLVRAVHRGSTPAPADLPGGEA